MNKDQARQNLLAVLASVVGNYPQVEVKTIDEYRSRLWRACVRLWNSGKDAAFIASFTRSVDEQLTKAWNEGAADVGVEPDEMTEDDIVILEAIINSENEFILGLADDIQAAKDAGKKRQDFDSEFGSRVDLWANRYTETVNRAHMVFGSKERLEWVIGATEEHCTTCLALNGIIAFGYEWDEARFHPQMPPNDLLECEGWRCDCRLEPTSSRRTAHALDRLLEIAQMGH